jgi:hypothetical protein
MMHAAITTNSPAVKDSGDNEQCSLTINNKGGSSYLLCNGIEPKSQQARRICVKGMGKV